MLSLIKQQVVNNVGATVYSKKLAVAKGELEGYACKLDGFQRALQELEMQLAEKELQVTMLKSIIQDSADTAVLQQQLAEALQQNAQLQEHHAAAEHGSLISKPQPYPCFGLQQQAPTWHTVQVAMLRKALSVANMRLTSAGMMPVAATSDLLQDEGCDVLLDVTQDQSAPFAAHTPVTYQCPPPRMPSTACSAISSSSRTGVSHNSIQEPSRGATTSPDLVPLCLLRRLSGANSCEEGTHTPVGAEAGRGSASSRCSSQADLLETSAAATAAGAAGVMSAFGTASTALLPGSRCACGSRWCCSSGGGCSSAGKRADTAGAAGSADVAAVATDDGEQAASELSEDEELEHGCVYGDQGWQGNADAPVVDNPLFLRGSPSSSPQRVGPAVSF